MRNALRLLGITFLLIFLSIYLSEWKFNTSWFPIVLINLIVISMLLEIFLRMKIGNRVLEVKLLFIALFIFLSFGSFYAGALLNRNFLSGRALIYENDDLLIEKGTLYKGINIQIDYYLLEHAFGKLLVKEVDHIRKPKNSTDCELKFMKHHVYFDECSKKFIP